jgi:CRP-like cAMP-binding protein
MKNELIEFLSKHVSLTEELKLAIAESGIIKSFKKKSLLLKEGQLCNECYFVLAGCIRSYYMKDGEDRTTDFFTEGQVVSPSCYGKNTPSDLYLACIEDTIAGVGTPALETEMYQKYPQLETLSRIMGESILSDYKDALDVFKLSSPEERYLFILNNRPDLVQRVPQHQLASYLGIKPESLSRIRKRTFYKKI